MWRVMPITKALAVAMLASAPDALAQVPSSRTDSMPSPWPTVRREPTVSSPGNTPGNTTSPGNTASSAAVADSGYIRQAIRGNYLEVALGQLADSRADDSAVEEFARRMVSEHNTMNESWTTLARNRGIATTVELSPAGQQAGQRLGQLSGEAFDRAYMAEMVRQHEQDLSAFQRMTGSASTPQVRELANRALPMIREHLELARQVAGQIGRQRTADRNERRDDRDNQDDRNDRGGLRAEDRAFVREVLADHLMHIRLAERARREARSNEVRRLAERIEEDFTEWQERWEKVAERYDVTPPSVLGRMHGQKVERLARASRANVDRTYAAIVAEHLQSVVPYFQKEGQAVRSAAVRRLVNDQLPVIREHLARARRLQGQASARVETSDRE